MFIFLEYFKTCSDKTILFLDKMYDLDIQRSASEEWPWKYFKAINTKFKVISVFLNV